MRRRLIAWAVLPQAADAPCVLMAESAEALMREAALRAHPRETGGILVGVWADRRPWVTRACEVPSADSGLAHYVLPAGVTRTLVEQLQRSDPRLGYLGDWHTHPMDMPASQVDRQTIRRLAVTTGRAGGEIVLLVARRRGDHYVFDADVGNRRGIRPASITRTGDLP